MKKVTFRGGIHPLGNQHGGKSPTRNKPIKELLPERVCIPMDTHLGAPSIPCVGKGDLVKLGQVIGEPAGPRGIPVHASVSGKVVDVGPVQQFGPAPSLCVTIESDGADGWVELTPLGTVEDVDKALIIPAIRDAGICGMGGAGFPTHAKLSLPPGKTVDQVIVNCAECETHLTSDHRLMIQEPERIVDGLRAVMRALEVSRGVIAIEDDKPEAIESVIKAAEGRTGVQVAVLKTKYPQGSEKQIITAVTGREVPVGGLPMDAHVVVINAETAAAVADAIEKGQPLISRLVTVTGAVKEPSNLLARVGTSFAEAVKAAGGYNGQPGKLLSGGTMTGLAAPDDTVSIAKTTNGIVVLTQKEASDSRELPCIRCGRCIMFCPTKLMPYRLMELAQRGDLETAEKEHLKDCILCGSCSYVCPSRRWLAPSIKNAKERLQRRS